MVHPDVVVTVVVVDMTRTAAAAPHGQTSEYLGEGFLTHLEQPSQDNSHTWGKPHVPGQSKFHFIRASNISVGESSRK